MDGFQVDDEVEVLPHLVVVVYVYFEALFSLTVKRLSIDVADEAYVLNVDICVLFEVSQLGKRVNNDTEDNVQQHCLYLDVVGHIEHRLEIEALNVFRHSGLCG